MTTFRLILGLAGLLYLAGCASPSPAPKLAGDHPPTAIVQLRPQFPYKLFEAGASGFATVQFTVAADGTVVHAVVIDASHEDFARLAIACISKWKFEPAIKDGQPVAARMVVPFTFENPDGH